MSDSRVIVIEMDGPNAKTQLPESGEPPYMEFAGDMDAKYQAEIDPWEQSGTTGDRAAYYDYARTKLVRRLQSRLSEEARGLEIGCGHGFLTDMLAQTFDMVGLDISETALKRAVDLNPGIEYKRYDVTADYVLEDIGKFHFVILSQLWWYVLHEIDQVLINCSKYLEPNGLLVLHQAFIDDQKYMKDVADGFDGALKLLMSYNPGILLEHWKAPAFRLVEAHYDDTGLLCYHDGLIILRKVG